MAIWRKCFTVAILLLAARSSAQELVKVPVQIPAITPAVTPFAVARDRGYYRQEGLDVQLVVMPSALGSQALLGGNVKFSTAGGAGLLPILRGAPVRFMFTSFSRPMFWLYSRSDIRSVESLKGKKVGVSSLGSGPDSLLREILKKHGLEGGRDVAIMAVGSGTARFFALQAGSVDAAMLSIPANLMAQDAGFRGLVSFTEQEWIELQGTVNVTDQLLASDPGLVEKFIRATLKGFIHFRDQRTGTIEILTRFLRTKEDAAAKIYDLMRPSLTANGTVSEEIQRKSLEHVVDRAGLKEPPRLEKIFDYSLALKVRNELRAKAWKP
ncbi:MAG: ABC transporter substrate-binding protein [Deltaproteobacteria bacterium]|jgi:ABC-type nitrate/sulfonate/bicarbonate transport system substrate-binding protein|nr:MAG: ABC transporter substrate-binding protein [Deltaproteobacteria bacterium]